MKAQMAYNTFLAILKAVYVANYLYPAICCLDLCKSTSDVTILERGGPYWSHQLENDMNKELKTISKFRKMDFSGLTVTKIEDGCGRMQNRMGILSDGTKICIRYRENLEQIQGELFSYHFSRILGMRNVLEARLLRIDKNTEFWRRVDLEKNSWDNKKLIIATKFIEETYPVHIPDILLKENFKIDLNTSFCGLSSVTKRFLLQWSDMVIFDYVIGNFDRVVSNMFNMQWYSKSLNEPIENLLQSRNGVLLFIDNEDGFSHGYRLLGRYEPYLRKLLQNLCIFRRETVHNIQRLDFLSPNEIEHLLWDSMTTTYNASRILDYIPKLSAKNINVFKNRINFVRGCIRECERRIS